MILSMQQACTTFVAIFIKFSSLSCSSLFTCCCVIPFMHHIRGHFLWIFRDVMHHIRGTLLRFPYYGTCHTVHHFRETFRRLCMPFYAPLSWGIDSSIARRYAPYSWVDSQILRMIQCTSYVGAFNKLYSSFVCHLRGTYFCVVSLFMLFGCTIYVVYRFLTPHDGTFIWCATFVVYEFFSSFIFDAIQIPSSWCISVAIWK